MPIRQIVAGDSCDADKSGKSGKSGKSELHMPWRDNLKWIDALDSHSSKLSGASNALDRKEAHVRHDKMLELNWFFA
jgi:hypothetical protein